MKVAIMQPTYWPWAGFFYLIHSVDHFVYLDDAQYERGTWQNRNRILLHGKPHWLTVPAVRQHLGDSIHTVTTDDRQGWRAKHARTVVQAYSRWPHGHAAISLAQELLESDTGETLAHLNMRIIGHLCALWNITTVCHTSSTLGIPGLRSERLIALCQHFGATEYVSPVGSAAYLEEDQFAAKSGLRLTFNPYQPAPYPQPGADAFVSHLSILDVIAALGMHAAGNYVRMMATHP